jgi:hypothetical protein
MQDKQAFDLSFPLFGVARQAPGRSRRAAVWPALLCAGLLQGCALSPHWDTVHDGLRTKVIDAASQAPLARAFAYGKVDEAGRAIVLARTDATGTLRLEPQRKLRFFKGAGEKAAPAGIVICKEGYAPQVVVPRAALSAEGEPPRKLEVERIWLMRSNAAALPPGPADAPSLVAVPARCEAQP